MGIGSDRTLDMRAHASAASIASVRGSSFASGDEAYSAGVAKAEAMYCAIACIGVFL